MRQILIIVITVSFVMLGCGNHYTYTNHPLLVVDKTTMKPLSGAVIDVRYAPITCGGPFSFLGAPDLPKTPQELTDHDGRAVIPLELEWDYGFTLAVEAPGYDRSVCERGRDYGSAKSAVPETIELAPKMQEARRHADAGYDLAPPQQCADELGV